MAWALDVRAKTKWTCIRVFATREDAEDRAAPFRREHGAARVRLREVNAPVTPVVDTPAAPAAPDAIDTAAEALNAAVLAVAHAAREVSNSAVRVSRDPDGNLYELDTEALADLREALKGWTEASNAAVGAIRDAAKKGGW